MYAPNKDSSENNESETFFRAIFDESKDNNFQHIINTGDYNVAPDHDMDTAGYLHNNNPFLRQCIRSRMMTNEITDIWRDKHPTTRSFTFDKLQKRNRTKARLDYFLIAKNTAEIVSQVYIDRTSNISDHRPAYFSLSSENRQRLLAV